MDAAKVHLAQVQAGFLDAVLDTYFIAAFCFFFIFFYPITGFHLASDGADLIGSLVGSHIGGFAEIGDRIVKSAIREAVLSHGVVVFHHTIG